MSPRPDTTMFNDYTVMQRKAEPPSQTWWVDCSRPEFYARLPQEAARMSVSLIERTIHPPILGGRLP